MDIVPMYVAAGIAILLIVLGFVALLTQKVYLDSDASGRIRIELPPGAYSAEVAVGSARKQIHFTIDNGAQLMRIETQ